MRGLIISGVVAGVLALNSAAMAEESAETYHHELTALSVGSFSTLEHAKRDSGYGVAEAEIVRIWPDRNDGVWLYQEQALLGYDVAELDATMKDRPYFARIIHSREIEPGIVKRTIHKLKNASQAQGAWQEQEPLKTFSPSNLEKSECSITVMRIAENFWRSESEKCPNAYKGAAYAVSYGITTVDQYANWDRGFKEDGTHVWGPATGGYIFNRKKERGK